MSEQDFMEIGDALDIVLELAKQTRDTFTRNNSGDTKNNIIKKWDIAIDTVEDMIVNQFGVD